MKRACAMPLGAEGRPVRSAWLAAWLKACLALLAVSASAHEVRPAYLRIEAAESTQGAAAERAPVERYNVLWKQPLTAGRLLGLTPVFPDGCEPTPAALDAAGNALARRFTLVCEQGLRGGTVAIDGLEATLTDVMLHVTLADGTRLSHLLKPTSPSFVVGEDRAAPLLAHLSLGIEHLLFGIDHVLFVVALLFFLPVGAGGRGLGKLVKTITAFTVAHSVTLGVSALGWLRVPQAPVEAVIALSIVFLAVERLRAVPRRAALPTVTAEHTWVVAFVFGLLHGFGFAGALADIGLPRENLLAALFLFNVGVEIGQLAVVAVGLGVVWALARARIQPPRHVALAPLYAIGAFAAYWFVARTAAIVA